MFRSIFPAVETLLLEEEVAMARSPANGIVTRAMLRQRAGEIALCRGRSAQTITKADWEQANRELTPTRPATRQESAVKEPALERWENEGGVIPATVDESTYPDTSHANRIETQVRRD